MNLLKLPDFVGVAAGGTATLKVPKYLMTLNRLVLGLGGTTFTKALIDSIKIKLGSRTVWSVDQFAGVTGGSYLDRINQYRGYYYDANHLVIDFTEREFHNIVANQLGAYDLSVMSDDLFIEVKIDATAVAPTLYALAAFTPPQSKTPGTPDPSQPIQKLVSVPFQLNTGGRFYLPFDPRGAIVKRGYFNFGGTTGVGNADANLWKLEVKKNGEVVFDAEEKDHRFVQQEFKKVPQAQMFVMDFCYDNNLSSALATLDARSLEWIMNFTAADSGVAMFEVIDKPYNL